MALQGEHIIVYGRQQVTWRPLALVGQKGVCVQPGIWWPLSPHSIQENPHVATGAKSGLPRNWHPGPGVPCDSLLCIPWGGQPKIGQISMSPGTFYMASSPNPRRQATVANF